MDIEKMRASSYLLPDPGGEVVRECLDEIELLTEYKNTVEKAVADAQAETCILKQRHCSCVPILKLELKRLKGLLK